MKNYKDILGALDDEGAVSVENLKSDKTRRKGQFADHLIVTFPRK